MRSATANTSFMLCEISTTARPLSASRRTSSSTCAVCATPRAAVGSSRMTTRLFHSTALAMATVWRWPPERLATRWRTDLTRCARRGRPGSARPLLHGRRRRARCRVRRLPAEEHVLDDVEVVAQREVLVDDLDAEGGGVARAVDRDRPALEAELARVVAVDAADALDQRGLAGAVVADQRGDLAGVDGEVDVAQHLDRAEALVDPAQLEQRRRGVSDRGHVGAPHGGTMLQPADRDAGAAPTGRAARRRRPVHRHVHATVSTRCRPSCTCAA